MSLESGRKLGLAASLIEVIMPVIIVIVMVLFIVSIIAAIPAASAGPNVTIPNFSLVFVGVLIPVGILTFVGIILFIIAMHRLSQYYNEPGIFKNALYGFILNIVGSVVAIAIEFVLILGSIGIIPQAGTVLSGATLTQLIFGFLAVFAISFVLGIISAVLYMRAFNMLAEKSGNGNFKTAGLLYLLGQVLTIVFIGGLLFWIAWIFAAMGFNTLRPKEPQSSLLPTPP
jgi:uncharacterized membrane protein